tara:strand:+ start:1121 stop:1246 length:126 start_codon:yes stop_codon:yes gene_type:complete
LATFDDFLTSFDPDLGIRGKQSEKFLPSQTILKKQKEHEQQ